ncbi:MAG TPA: YjjG family noncanonical pyrimidine nucleotidase [Ohtaekwangia sp.]|nr:YjjG family noncanonical pyrimidine nucleotidase [Ohtaekwangia sp.]
MEHIKRKKYKSVFFDLDHTLWDYDTNSKETLHELYRSHDLHSKGVHSFDDFFNTFKTVNFNLWEQFDRGLITSDVIRTERFKQCLEPFQAFEEKRCEALTNDYLAMCPMKCNLMPKTLETLDYLSSHYNLTIITNGFDEIQQLKLTSGNLHRYFDHVITSQKAGHRKPAREIFEYALRLNNVHSHEAIMIGDNPITDIGGAQNAAIDAVLFNPEKLKYNITVDFEISCLHELREFL